MTTRIVNEKFETVDPSSIDLQTGYVYETSIIRTEAVPPDNVTKFAYDDEDYEQVMVYTRIPEQEVIRQQVNDKKHRLSETDYVVIKIAEGAATFKEYAGIIAERQALREEINELEQVLETEGNLSQ